MVHTSIHLVCTEMQVRSDNWSSNALPTAKWLKGRLKNIEF